MKYIITLALAVGGFACSGDEAESELAHPDAKPTDYISAETLALAENDAQEVCLLSGFIISARAMECDLGHLYEGGVPSDDRIITACESIGMPIHQSLLRQQACHEAWSQAKCGNLVGPRSDATQPELCRMVYDPSL